MCYLDEYHYRSSSCCRSRTARVATLCSNLLQFSLLLLLVQLVLLSPSHWKNYDSHWKVRGRTVSTQEIFAICRQSFVRSQSNRRHRGAPEHRPLTAPRATCGKTFTKFGKSNLEIASFQPNSTYFYRSIPRLPLWYMYPVLRPGLQ